jgi:hypothetical protein
LHAPQFAASLSRSTHELPLHNVWPDAHPDTHRGDIPAGAAHNGVVPPHASAHVPQLPGVRRLVSHPNVVAPSQSAKPGVHSRPHAPFAHTARAFAPPAHAVAHVSQCCGSVFRFTSHPFARSWSQSA